SQTILQNVLARSSGQAAAAGSAAEMAGQAAEAAQAATSAAEAATGGAQAAQAASAAQMAAAATHTAAGAAVKTAVYGAGKALAMKIIAAVAAVAVVAGGTVAAVHHFRNSGGNGPDTVVTQPASSKSAETLPAPTEQQPTVPEQPTEAPRPTVPPVPETPPMPTLPTEPETMEGSTEALSWGEAYQEVLEICRKDLQGGSNLEQSILPRYKGYFNGTEANLSNEFQYAVRDVNEDGTPELILAAYAFPELEKERGCLVFEVFTFDGAQAVPLFWNVRESLYRLEQVYVSENGTLWCTSGNSGHNPTYVFELPPGGTALKQTVFLDPIDGTNDFRVIVDGKQTGTMTMHEFWHEWIPVNAVLEYHEIWEDLQTSY
ncbi:MAG: hypothetical protein J5865_01140, partial [Lachnospiraceae bacterium]|nr:hypothetical protein [Lachnospiraceae bacterium]